MKKYDALYIFVNAAREDAIEPLLEKVSGDITRLGGNVLGSELLGKKTSNGTATGSDLAADGDNKLLFGIHRGCYCSFTL